MIKFFKKIILSLEARFPEKVTVTLEAYQELYNLIGEYNVALQALDRRLRALEANVEKPQEGLTDLKADVQKCLSEVSKLQVVMGFSRGGSTLER